MSAQPKPAEEFVPMCDEDLTQVVQIESVIYPFPWTRGNFLDSLRAGYSAWTLRNRNGAIVGYAVMMLSLDEAHLLNLSVALHEQRSGLGWRLLEWMAEVARGYGARTMMLEVRPSNEPALRLYKTYGFECIGVRRGYYPAAVGREDAVVMRISL
jgi:[ribosomal protein S18]-alanine N-acetyltransferase